MSQVHCLLQRTTVHNSRRAVTRVNSLCGVGWARIWPRSRSRGPRTLRLARRGRFGHHGSYRTRHAQHAQREPPMSAIPTTFRAFVAEQVGATGNRGVQPFAEADLPPGEVEVRVLWSSVNYKDGLATIAGGKVARISPLIAGIDLAGEVVASTDVSIPVGIAVIAHAYDVGVSRHGGFAEYQRVPAHAQVV